MPNSKKSLHAARWRSYQFLLINVVCWGAALPIVKPALSYTTPFRYLLYRFIIAGLLCLPVIWYFIRKRQVSLKRLMVIVPIEFIGTIVSLGVLYYGLSRTTSLQASLISTCSPLFTVLAGVIYLHEKEERHEWIGLLLAFTGTVLITVTPLLFGKTAFSYFSLTGNLLIFLQNIIGAGYSVLTKKYFKTIPKLLVTSVSFYLGIFGFALLSLWQVGGQLPTLVTVITQDLTHPSVWFACLYMATFGSIIAATASLKGQEGIEASEATLFGYLTPLIYFPLSVFILHEELHTIDIVGLLIVLAGVVIAEVRMRTLFHGQKARKYAIISTHKQLSRIKRDTHRS